MIALAEEKKSPKESRTLETSKRIARAARRRIELIAPRIPGARAFLRPQDQVPTKADRVVVISDTHLGDPNDILASDSTIGALTDTIEGLGAVDELVLLGDIFDFWQSTFGDALERGRSLMSALYNLPNVRRMVYLPGNHDHHIYRTHYEEEVSRRLRAGNLDPPEMSIPPTKDCPAMEALRPEGSAVPLYMTYPMYQVLVGGKVALLTHGHLLGFFERSLWRPKHSRFSSIILNRAESLDLADMELFISPYYEMIMLSTYVPGVIEGRYRVYRMISRTANMWGVSSETRASKYRDTTIEENAVEIEAFLDHFCPEKPDYFIYGHTHKAGRLRLPLSGTTAINTGCWLSDRGLSEASRTLLEITDEARFIDVES